MRIANCVLLCQPPPQAIKDLAWNNTYELSNIDGTLTKKAYKKTGLKTFALDKTFTKATLDAAWSALAKIFEFDGDLSGLSNVKLENVYYVKVSDKFFDTNDLIGSTINLVGKVGDEEIEPTYTITEANIGEDSIEDEATNEIGKLIGVFIEDAGDKALLFSFTMNFAGFESGTYFITDIFEEGCAYTKSISCLTETDALKLPRIPLDDIFSLDLANGFDNLQYVNVDNELTYIKVTDKHLTERDLLYYNMALYASIANIGDMQGIINPEYITAFSDESNANNYIAVSILACFEQNGWEGSNDFPAILSSSTAFTYQNQSFESGTYFVLARTTHDGYLYLKSVSSLSKADAIQI